MSAGGQRKSRDVVFADRLRVTQVAIYPIHFGVRYYTRYYIYYILLCDSTVVVTWWSHEVRTRKISIRTVLTTRKFEARKISQQPPVASKVELVGRITGARCE